MVLLVNSVSSKTELQALSLKKLFLVKSEMLVLNTELDLRSQYEPLS